MHVILHEHTSILIYTNSTYFRSLYINDGLNISSYAYYKALRHNHGLFYFPDIVIYTMVSITFLDTVSPTVVSITSPDTVNETVDSFISQNIVKLHNDSLYHFSDIVSYTMV